MRRGNEITVKIEKTEFPSVGISSFDGKKIYVKNAFPGETVKGRVKKKKADYADLKLIEVVEKAPYEIEAKCPHFGICGGCSSQHLSYDKQLELLSDEVLELFKNAEVTTGEYEGVVGSVDQFEYRNKMEFTFGDEYKGGELCLGMHMRNQSFGIITVNECKLVDEDFRKVINATVEYFRGKDLPYYRVMKREGYLRHLVIRKAKNTGELLVNLVTTTQVDFDLTEWTNIIKGLDFQGELVSILHT